MSDETLEEVRARADREMQSWQYEREAYQRRCAAAEAEASEWKRRALAAEEWIDLYGGGDSL